MAVDREEAEEAAVVRAVQVVQEVVVQVQEHPQNLSEVDIIGVIMINTENFTVIIRVIERLVQKMDGTLV